MASGAIPRIPAAEVFVSPKINGGFSMMSRSRRRVFQSIRGVDRVKTGHARELKSVIQDWPELFVGACGAGAGAVRGPEPESLWRGPAGPEPGRAQARGTTWPEPAGPARGPEPLWKEPAGPGPEPGRVPEPPWKALAGPEPEPESPWKALAGPEPGGRGGRNHLGRCLRSRGRSRGGFRSHLGGRLRSGGRGRNHLGRRLRGRGRSRGGFRSHLGGRLRSGSRGRNHLGRRVAGPGPGAGAGSGCRNHLGRRLRSRGNLRGCLG